MKIIALLVVLLICSVGLSSATSTYNITTNSISITGNNTIAQIFSEVNNNSVLSYNSTDNSYELNARIIGESKGNINISDTTLYINGSSDDEYYIESWNLTINNATIKSKQGNRFYIWASKTGRNGYSAMVDNVVIDGGFLRFRPWEYLYDTPSPPYINVLNTTIKNVNMTGAHMTASPTLLNAEATVLTLGSYAGYNALLQNVHIDNVSGGEIYSGTIYFQSNAQNLTLRDIRITNSSHPHRGVIWWYGAPQNLTMDNVTIDGVHDGVVGIKNVAGSAISNKEGLWEVGKTHYYKNITLLNFDGYGFYTYQNMFVGNTSGARIENLIMDGGTIGDAYQYLFGQDYTEIVNIWVFNAELRNTNKGFKTQNNIISITNALVENITQMYYKNGQSGEVDWYELLDLNVTYTNGTAINNATIIITPNVTAPIPNVVDKWFNNRSLSAITTGADGHIPLPSDEEEMVALLRERAYTAGADISHYNYTITASKAGFGENSTTVIPSNSWYRSNPNIPVNTIHITIPSWVATPNKAYISKRITIFDDGSTQATDTPIYGDVPSNLQVRVL
jgi:hypothetical protein